MKITLLEPIGISQALLSELSEPIRAAGHEFCSYADRTCDPGELAERSRGSEVVMIANTPYPNEVIRANPSLKMIDVAFTGIDHIGHEACRERGVQICNAANYSNQTVAELVIGLTIGLLRKIDLAGERVRTGGTAAGLMGREIAGRTVGIIGTGRIGMLTARLFHAFGARLIAYSRSRNPEAESLGMPYVSLEELLRESDIVSLHTPSNAATRGMIGAEQIALMKPDALFINCARGPIVDSRALADALNEGRIAGAGIDVFETEPPLDVNHPLLHTPNTIVTPHVAFASKESMALRAQIVFDSLDSFIAGKQVNVIL